MLSTLLLFSCGEKKSNIISDENIFYKNDSLFCSGKYRTRINGKDTTKTRFGYWFFYKPDGIMEHDEKYDSLGYKTLEEYFYDNDSLKSYTSFSSDWTYFEEYLPNGSISLKHYTITKYEHDEDSESETKYDSIWNYHKNGNLFCLKVFEDDDLKSEKYWDSTGVEILNLKYPKSPYYSTY